MTPQNPEVICYGEALADCFPEQTVIGGAPLNVARHLAQLGCTAHIMTALADDDLGREIRAACRYAGVLTDLVFTTSKAPTGRVRIDSNNDTGHTFHIESNSAWDYIEPTSKTKSVLRRSACLVYGTLAMRSAVSRHTFLELIDGFSGLAICDFNWREGHLSLHDAIGIAQKSQWLKINETELALLLEYFGLQQVTVLLQTMGIELCLITRGEQGYDVYGQEGLLLHGKAHEVGPITDTVGAGDSFLACTLAAHLQGAPLSRALSLAAQFAAAICGVRGAVPSDLSFYTPYLEQIRQATQSKNNQGVRP